MTASPRIYHITTADAWAQARQAGEYRLSTRGVTLAQQGFIHASTAAQVALVANAVYRGEPGLIVLEIDTARVAPEIRYETPPGETQSFPHIYGPLAAPAVIRVLPLAADDTGTFHFTPSYESAPGRPATSH
jgi:uncharacterized protein (DUF952 family)